MSDENTDLSELYTEITGQDGFTQEQETDESRIRDEDAETRPTIEVSCPECENNKAYYEMEQLRSADESETRFFECTECGHRWREDDH